MEFFSNEIASTLQFFTFPLEVIGLALATIEVRFPSLASRLAGHLIEEVNNAERDITNLKRTMKKKELAMATIGVSILVFAVFTSGYPNTVVFGSVLSAAVLSISYVVAVKWVPDRTVGTLGIIIAGFAILGEAYQFTTQMVT